MYLARTPPPFRFIWQGKFYNKAVKEKKWTALFRQCLATTMSVFLNCKARSPKVVDSEFRQVLKSPAA